MLSNACHRLFVPCLVAGVALALGCGGSSTPSVGDVEAITGDDALFEIPEVCTGLACLDDTAETRSDDGTTADPLEQQGDDVDDSGEVQTCAGNKLAFLAPCQNNEDCCSGFCVLAACKTGERVCTTQCLDECPTGFGCQQIGFTGGDPIFVCMPKCDPLCNLECLKDADCALGNSCQKQEKSQYCLRACGGEGVAACPADYDCKDATSVDGKTSMQCVPKSGHCKCSSDVNYQTDVNHCGGCESPCKFDHGQADCQAAVCKLAACDEGYFNLNGIEADGCEYQCTFKGFDDEPDANYEDSNCDGIDGNIEKAIFVDGKKGSDDGDGTMTHPLKTIGQGILKAGAATPKMEVYVSTGLYQEKVTLMDGVSVFGGFDAVKKDPVKSPIGWGRNVEGNVANIGWNVPDPSAVVTVVAREIISKTVFDGFHVQTANAVESGSSSYGMYVFHASSALIVSNNHLAAGNGADGKAGDYGENGLNGGDGGMGSNGYEYGADGFLCSFGQCKSGGTGAIKAGNAGTSPCGSLGGKGGRGGESNSSGGNGEPGVGGATGGTGGGSTHPGAAGQPGKAGNNGMNGAGGSATGATNPINASGFWSPGAGADGGNGTDGGGGGGGGAGGGDSIDAAHCCQDSGGSGGGGGGGGCHGIGGKAGTGGGGSFAVFVVEASPLLQGNTLTSQSGGNGGNGGLGGKAGAAGQSGQGGPGGGGSDQGATGASGGTGGTGGNGGGGGGGAGGPTYGVYVLGGSSNPACTGNTYAINGFPGAGGSGGAGSNKGDIGQSGSVFGVAPNCPAE